MRIGLHFECPMRRNTKDLSSRETFMSLIDPARPEFCSGHMVGIWFKKKLSLLGSETAASHPPIQLFDLKTPQNVSLLDSDNPTTFPQRTGLTFFRRSSNSTDGLLFLSSSTMELRSTLHRARTRLTVATVTTISHLQSSHSEKC